MFLSGTAALAVLCFFAVLMFYNKTTEGRRKKAALSNRMCVWQLDVLFSKVMGKQVWH